MLSKLFSNRSLPSSSRLTVALLRLQSLLLLIPFYLMEAAESASALIPRRKAGARRQGFRGWRDRASLTWSRENGDVPGWVLIAVMTVGLVMLIWAVAGPALTGLFNNAVNRVNIV